MKKFNRKFSRKTLKEQNSFWAILLDKISETFFSIQKENFLFRIFSLFSFQTKMISSQNL